MKYLLALTALLSASFSANSEIIEYDLSFLEGRTLSVTSPLSSVGFDLPRPVFEEHVTTIAESELFLDFEENTVSAPRQITLLIFADYVQWANVEPGSNQVKKIGGGNWANPDVYIGGEQDYVIDYWDVSFVLWPTDKEGNYYPLEGQESITFGSGSYLKVSDTTVRVPETGTFALFLLGAVGLCVRRQMKQQA